MHSGQHYSWLVLKTKDHIDKQYVCKAWTVYEYKVWSYDISNEKNGIIYIYYVYMVLYSILYIIQWKIVFFHELIFWLTLNNSVG